MKILIGTLKSEENEFEQCCKSISDQIYIDYNHVIIEGLNAIEAHRELFRRFMQQSEEFDLLIKVDADMVLSRSTIIAEIADQFQKKSELHHYQVAVYDWYTDRLIYGINAYRNTVIWKESNSIFCENSALMKLKKNGTIIDFPRECRTRDKDIIAPAAYHSPNPSSYQAFHFGLHKGVKAVESALNHNLSRVNEHCENIQLTYKHYIKIKDRRLLLAALAGEIAIANKLNTDYASYKYEKACKLGEKYSSIETVMLEKIYSIHLDMRHSKRLSLYEYCIKRSQFFYKFYFLLLKRLNSRKVERYCSSK